MAGMHHGAQADDADAQAGFAKNPVLHGRQHRTAVAATASGCRGFRELLILPDSFDLRKAIEWTASTLLVTMAGP